VPGNVELDLVRAEVIPEFYGDSVRRLRAFEPCEWRYTREFTLPAGETGADARGSITTLAA